MKYLFLLCTLLFVSIAQSADIEHLKWHLNPNGQGVLIEQDDLHNEEVEVSSSLDFGYAEIAKYKLKKKVKVAVIDSGIDYSHPDFKNVLAYKSGECFDGNIIPAMENDNDNNDLKNDCLGWNFASDNNDVEDTDGHGTHVAGLIRDIFSLHTDYLQILPLRIFADDDKKPLPIKLGMALEYALKENVDLIHLSMGWPESLMSVKLERLIEQILEKGIMIVSAAGNSAQRANIYPCRIAGVICVGATRPNAEIADFSNYGPQVDIYVPGEKILSTIPMAMNPVGLPIKGYDYKSGTSQAAPLVSGALLFLKAFSPEENIGKLARRLLQSSNGQQVGFNLPRSISHPLLSKIVPEFKHLNTILKGESSELEFGFVNYFDQVVSSDFELQCEGSDKQKWRISAMPRQRLIQKINLKVSSDKREVQCRLSDAEVSYNFSLRIINNIKFDGPEYVVEEARVILPTRTGARSKLISIPLHNGFIRSPFFYLAGEDDFVFISRGKTIGRVSFEKDCKKLRIWQVDLNKDSEQDVMLEELCDGKFLRYHFYDQNLQELFPKIIFKPKYSIINYSDFHISWSKSGPIFRYQNLGTVPPSKDPWEASPRGKSDHIYEVRAKLVEGKYEFFEAVLDDPKLWAKQLELRYTPNFNILNLIDGKILFKYKNDYYWSDLNSKKLEKTPLSSLLIAGDRFERILGTKSDLAINTLITPYEFRSHIMNGPTLRGMQNEFHDPVMRILSVQKTTKGFEVNVKSYLSLYRYQFDHFGQLTSKQKYQVERFDFVSGDELDALVIPIEQDGDMHFFVDGSKIHTNYIDVISQKVVSLAVPKNCVTQLPVTIDKESYLSFACFENGQGKLKFVAVETLLEVN